MLLGDGDLLVGEAALFTHDIAAEDGMLAHHFQLFRLEASRLVEDLEGNAGLAHVVQQRRRRQHRQISGIDAVGLGDGDDESAHIHAVHGGIRIVLLDPRQRHHGIDVAQDGLGDHLAGSVHLLRVDALTGGHILHRLLEGFRRLVADLGGPLDLFIIMNKTSRRRRFTRRIRERLDVVRQVVALVGVDGDHRQTRLPQPVDEGIGGDQQPAVLLDPFVHLAGEAGALGPRSGANGIPRLEEAAWFFFTRLFDDDIGVEKHAGGEMVYGDEFFHNWVRGAIPAEPYK